MAGIAKFQSDHENRQPTWPQHASR
jgi:hypothetical protein